MTLPVVQDHTARAHSTVVGGSSAGRVLQCAGSVRLAQEYPNTSSEYAEEGTALHMAMDMIMSGLTETDREVIGLEFNGYTITEEMFDEALEPILDYWDNLDKELGGIEFLTEQRVVFPYIKDAFGTTDIIGASKDRTIVFDHKFGRGVPVSAEKNPQGLYYGLAALHTPATKRFFHHDRPVEIIIAQPRVRDGEQFTRWVTTVPQLEAFGIELKQAVERGMEPDAPFQMGPYCRFCPAKIGCPLYQGQARDSLALSRDELVERIAEWLPQADNLIELGTYLKDKAHELLEQGATIPGYKLVSKRAQRSWDDEERTVKYFAKLGLPAADRFVKKLISPAQAEKVLKAAKLPAELPAHLVRKESSGTTLAPESDKRPAVLLATDALKQLADRLKAK